MKKPTTLTALVTGATSPIGRAIALALAQDGISIMVHYNHSQKKALQLCDEIEKSGARAWSIREDFKKTGEVESLVKRAKRLAGRVDVLVNNASVYTRSTIDNMQYGDLLDNMTVNAWAPLALARSLRSVTGRGCVVNILDSRITGGDNRHAGYIISKHALAAMTVMMAREFAPDVRVNCVAPGLVLKKPGDERKLKALAKALPLQKFCRPEDVADAVLFLVRSQAITGQVLFVDSGRHIRS